MYIDNLVSVITPVYNAEMFVEQTIKSVLFQTYKDWEMILVDDCSNDSSVEIIKKYINLDERFKYYKLEKNAGAANARNYGIRKAKGRYVAFLDSDDLWEEDKLDFQLNFMKLNNVEFTFSNYSIIDQNGEMLNKIIKVPSKISYTDYLKNTIIGCLTVVIDRYKISNIKFQNIKMHEDMATWLSILKNDINAYGINECLARYRIVNNSLSSNKIKAVNSVWNIYREIENLNLIQSLLFVSCYIFNALKKRM